MVKEAERAFVGEERGLVAGLGLPEQRMSNAVADMERGTMKHMVGRVRSAFT